MEEVADIVSQLGAAVSEMHRMQVVHHDLKPGNIMLENTPSGDRVRIIDFGIARLVGEVDDLRSTGDLLVGTPSYMSPEQAHGKVTDPRSDIFSLGAVAYEMLTGRKHIQLGSRHRGADGYLEYLQSKEPLPTQPARHYRPGLPDDVDDILACALSRSRHARPPTVEMFCDDLEVMLRAHAPVHAKPRGLLGRTLNKLRRRR